MAGFWEGFSKTLAQHMGAQGQRLLQESAQERAEDRGLGTFKKQLDIKEPYDVRAQQRATQARKQLMQMNMQLDQQREEQRAEYRAELASAYNDPGFMKMREKAAKGDDPIAQTYVMLIDKEMSAVMRGEKDFDIKVADGMSPIVRQRYTQAWIMNRDKERDYQMRKNEVALRMKQLEETIAYRESLTGRREYQTQAEVGEDILKMREEYLTTRSTLLKEFDIKADKKGRYKIPWAKNVPLFDKEGRITPEAKAEILKRHPTADTYFRLLDVYMAQLTRLEDVKSRFGERKEQPEIPEDWIVAAMKEKGLTREEAIAAYKRFKGQK